MANYDMLFTHQAAFKEKRKAINKTRCSRTSLIRIAPHLSGSILGNASGRFPDSSAPLRVKKCPLLNIMSMQHFLSGTLVDLFSQVHDEHRKKRGSLTLLVLQAQVCSVADFLTPNQHIFMSSASTNADSSN